MEQVYNFLFSDGGYSPHGFCIAWNLPVLFTHIGADLLIAFSYFAIPALIVVFLRQRPDPALRAPALLFVAFISACGLSHLMSIVTMYFPFYGLQGILKLITGIISFVTVIALWKMLPSAVKIPSPSSLLQAVASRDREIAERTETQAELIRRNTLLDQKIREAEAANQELREFAYAASHDLKAPANTLSLWLQFFQEEYGDRLDEDGRTSLGEADRIVSRMRGLVEDVLKYARVVKGNATDRKEIDMTALFGDVLEDLAPEVQRARAKVDIAPMPRLKGYDPLISILAHNLIANALKFRSPDRKAHIVVSGDVTAGQNPAFVLRVKDNGIGIDPAHKTQIFGLFQRLHRPEDYEGTGLGLALCRRIAVTHGGDIKVHSTEGEGSEFIITFPLEHVYVAEAA